MALPCAVAMSPLGEAVTPLERVVPRSVLDDATLPDGPVRIATRPGKLAWRPGLAEAAEELKDAFDDGAPPALPERLKSENAEKLEGEKAQKPEREQAATSGPALTSPAQQEVEKATEPESPRELELPAGAAKPLPIATPREPRTPSKPTKAAKPAPKKKVTTPAPKSPPPPLSRGLRNLRFRLRTVLSHYYKKSLNSAEHDPWEIMHSMLSYELHSRIYDGGPRGKPMTAVGHLCFNRPSKRQQLMRLTPDGKIDAPIGVGLQGHKGQFLAMLAQCNVSPDYPIRVDDTELTIQDLVEAEQKTCYKGEELTFKLIGLGHYLDSDETWLNDQGESWGIPRLIEEERKQPIRGAACGGTHRLAGLGLAVRRREARGEPIDGEYLEAARFVAQHQAYAFRLQNRDGSMSTEWFRGPGDEEDLERRIRTSGHTVEWLAYSLTDDELRSSRMVRAVNYLTNLLAHNSDKEWHLGSQGHAIHALLLYDKRVFRPHDTSEDADLVAVDPTGRLYRGYKVYRGVLRRTPPESRGFLGLFGNAKTSQRR